MPRVHVLPDSLVDQIAAGEVVERPASVVKELVENALDAGARRIAVEAEGGGVARLSVLDDGCGMEPEDARLAMERHATSKIRSADDLARIATLGFRGEALPSIASVSRLVVTTSPDGSGLGSEVTADRGAPPSLRPARHPRGTRVVVEDLFGNVPARRKFLKSPEAELRAIVRMLTSLALARPDVSFILTSNGRVLLDLPAVESVTARLGELLGRAADGERPIALTATASGVVLSGGVLPASVSFPSRAYQWLFVNGRAVKDSTVSHAISVVARDATPQRHPALAPFLTIDPSLCDVNVHPQKLEVRLRDPDTVHRLVHRALLSALLAERRPTAVPAQRLSYEPPEERGAPAMLAEVLGGAWGMTSAAAPATASYAAAATAVEVPRAGSLRLLAQYRDAYLLAQGDEGLVLVDQHAAHERVRYERIRARLRSGAAPSQGLLLPVTYEASLSEAPYLARALPLLERAGFAVSELSGRTLSISAAPADCPSGAVAPFLRDLLASVAALPEAGDGSATARLEDALAASLACRGAVMAGKALATPEAVRLLTDLSACDDPFSCAHGRPTMLTFAHGDLLRRFGRSVPS